MSNNLKAAVLIGFSTVMSGICDANAATTTPVTQTFFIQANFGSPVTQPLAFAQFNPSLGTLTSVDFSLASFTNSGGPAMASVQVSGSSTALGNFTGSVGPFDFSNVTGLQGGLTTADFTGSGNIDVDLNLTSLNAIIVAEWFSSTLGAPAGIPAGLTLVYDYTPAAPATPLPAGLPLFATGLGALGLLGWFRKRKAHVSLLGAA
jgi:hypothetical protein